MANFIIKGLTEKNYIVDHQLDGKDGLFLGTTEHYDVMIVDRMLPSVDGLTIIRTLRASNIDTPILILSAMADVEDRVEGLRGGADDYLVKPFSFSELEARIDILSRRKISKETLVTERVVADLKIDLLSHKVTRDKQDINLLATEYRLLEYLMQSVGKVVTRTMLLENVWDYHFDPQTNVIDVHMSRLRKKIDKPFDSLPLIHTVRGSGYILKEP